jgi:hypothetical protein
MILDKAADFSVVIHEMFGYIKLTTSHGSVGGGGQISPNKSTPSNLTSPSKSPNKSAISAESPVNKLLSVSRMKSLSRQELTSDTLDSRSSDEALLEIAKQKVLRISVREKVNDDEMSVQDIELQDMNLRVIGFENERIFHHFGSVLSNDSEHVFVVISHIYGTVQEMSVKLQTVCSISPNPIIVLGVNDHI